MQSLLGMKFTSSGLLGQGWCGEAGVASLRMVEGVWRTARDVFRGSGRTCALCNLYSLVQRQLPVCVLLQAAKLVSIFPTHPAF